jgi:hypothetical protein
MSGTIDIVLEQITMIPATSVLPYGDVVLSERIMCRVFGLTRSQVEARCVELGFRPVWADETGQP